MALVIFAPGLSFDMAIRGDSVPNLSDLIADGCIAEVEGAPAVAPDAVRFRLGAIEEFDAYVGTRRGDAKTLVVLSESVFITNEPVPSIRPGTKLRGEEVAAILRSL